MSKKNRDDFSQSTINRAAQRAGYRCSYCRRPTIGPSMEGENAVSNIGVAAHICAAAPGGKRYNKDMTPAERKSIENCIWMCQLHAHLIDTDEIKYSVEYLKSMKAEAEKDAADAIADTSFFEKYYSHHQNHIEDLINLFDKMISDGNFDLLSNTLGTYSVSLSPEYDEIIARYRVIFDTYCCRELVERHLEDYLLLFSPKGVDQLIELFVAFNDVDSIKKILHLCQDRQLLLIATDVAQGILEGKVFRHIDSDKKDELEIPKEKVKLINNFIFNSAARKRIFNIQYEDGRPIESNCEEVYYSLLLSAIRLSRKIISKNANCLTFAGDADYIYLFQRINVIKQLDYSLQAILWEAMLQYAFEDQDKFEALFSKMPPCVLANIQIEIVRWLFDIRYSWETINIDSLLDFCEKNKNYKLLVRYLHQLPASECSSFLDERKYLFRKDSRLIQVALRVNNNSISYQELLTYQREYENDMVFHCLCYRLSSDPREKNEQLMWIIGHRDDLEIEDALFYLEVMDLASQWEQVLALKKYVQNCELMFHIGSVLISSKDPTYIEEGLRILKELDQEGWNCKSLYFNIGACVANSGRSEEAKGYFQKEYDLHRDEKALYNLLQLRCETNDVLNDIYLHQAERIVSARFQNIVAGTYYALRQKDKAREFALRTLLIDDKSPCIGALCSFDFENEEESAESVVSGVVCVLESPNETINIAIHDPALLKGITPNTFANCEHYAANDSIVSPLMYYRTEDSVVYRGDVFIVRKIIPVWTFLARYAFSEMARHETTMVIKGNTIEEAIENLKAFLKESQEQLDNVIEVFNASTISPPLSLFAHQTGKSCLKTIEFLMFENKKQIVNNVNDIKLDSDIMYILSYDAIVHLATIKVLGEINPHSNILCANQVRHQLEKEILDEIDDMSSKNKEGLLSLVDDNLHFTQPGADVKRVRHGFLTSISSFLNSLPVEKSYDYISLDGALQSIFSKRDMQIENGTLGLLQHVKNAVLVSDDQFLMALAQCSGQRCIGICAFLGHIMNDSGKLLDCSKGLATINFQNYLPLCLFKKIVSELAASDKDVKRQEINREIIKWLLSDRDSGEVTKNHREIIVRLYRDFLEENPGKLGTNTALAQIAIRHFLALNPGYIQEVWNQTMQELKEDGATTEEN